MAALDSSLEVAVPENSLGVVAPAVVARSQTVSVVDRSHNAATDTLFYTITT